MGPKSQYNNPAYQVETKESVEFDKQPPPKLDRFVRLVEVTRPTDHFPAYQPEIVFLHGDKVVERRMISKPDLFAYAHPVAIDMVDPRNNNDL